MSTPILLPASRLAPSATASTVGKGRSGAVGRGLGGRSGMQGAGLMRMGIGVKTLLRLDRSDYTHRWSSEEMKFRLAFIVWPALIGLSMTV